MPAQATARPCKWRTSQQSKLFYFILSAFAFLIAMIGLCLIILVRLQQTRIQPLGARNLFSALELNFFYSTFGEGGGVENWPNEENSQSCAGSCASLFFLAMELAFLLFLLFFPSLLFTFLLFGGLLGLLFYF